MVTHSFLVTWVAGKASIMKAGDRHPSHCFVVDVKHRLNKTGLGEPVPLGAGGRTTCKWLNDHRFSSFLLQHFMSKSIKEDTTMQYSGAFTALVTPYKNSMVDEDAYRALIEWQIEQGIDGLVPCGTTGESATLSHEEHKQVISICVDQVKGRVPVIAGAGSNCTREAIELTRYAKEAGADATLLITPYYNKPTPEGVVAHFKAIASDVSIPFVVYNVPGRTSLNVMPKTVARIYKEIPEAIGIKEATGDLRQVSEVVEECGPDFIVLSGDDFTVLPLLSVGGHGVISVVSNIVPAMMHAMCKAYAEKNLEQALKLHFEMAPLCRAMLMETNPSPVKTSLALMGKMQKEFRLPMVPMLPENEERLESLLSSKGLI